MDNRPIIQTNYGLASSYENFVEMNYKLTSSLKDKIKRHELRHSPDRHYSKQDFINDFQSENSYFMESLKFAIMNPECLIGFFPLMYSYYAKQFTFNSSAIYPFLYFGLIFSGFFWFLFRINFFLSFLGFSILILLINIALLGITHYYVCKDVGFLYKEVLE